MNDSIDINGETVLLSDIKSVSYGCEPRETTPTIYGAMISNYRTFAPGFETTATYKLKDGRTLITMIPKSLTEAMTPLTPPMPG